MKYWWLEKYLNLEVKQIPQLYNDIRYFLIMPKNYISIYNEIKDRNVDDLLENELLINLYVLVNTKKINSNRILVIIKKLLTYPDTNLPISDYTLKDIFNEIKNLKSNYPNVEKLDVNNICACYNCGEIFYVDLVKAVNKKGYCLCPFCGKTLLYFDNDYIPMNTSFIKMASLYYGVSQLGCRFNDIIKMIKENVSFTMSNIIMTDWVIRSRSDSNGSNTIYVDYSIVDGKRISSFEESVILKNYYDAYKIVNDRMVREVSIIIPKVDSYNTYQLALLVLISIMDSLSEMIYLKKIKVICEDLEIYENLRRIYKEIISFGK